MAADNAAGGGTMPDDVGMAPGDDTVPVPQSGAEKPAMGPPIPQSGNHFSFFFCANFLVNTDA